MEHTAIFQKIAAISNQKKLERIRIIKEERHRRKQVKRRLQGQLTTELEVVFWCTLPKGVSGLIASFVPFKIPASKEASRAMGWQRGEGVHKKFHLRGQLN